MNIPLELHDPVLSALRASVAEEVHVRQGGYVDRILAADTFGAVEGLTVLLDLGRVHLWGVQIAKVLGFAHAAGEVRSPEVTRLIVESTDGQLVIIEPRTIVGLQYSLTALSRIAAIEEEAERRIDARARSRQRVAAMDKGGRS